jgi:hypothetical protein
MESSEEEDLERSNETRRSSAVRSFTSWRRKERADEEKDRIKQVSAGSQPRKNFAEFLDGFLQNKGG